LWQASLTQVDAFAAHGDAYISAEFDTFGSKRAFGRGGFDTFRSFRRYQPRGFAEQTCTRANLRSMNEMFRHLPFPFPDGRFPPQLGAVVQKTVLDGEEPAREVIHTEDNSWLVGDGVYDPNLPGASVATHFMHVLEVDPTLVELASLPIGYIATREGPEQPWRLARHVWPDDL